MIETTLRLTFADRLRAEIALACANPASMLAFLLFPACGVMLLAFDGDPSALDVVMDAWLLAMVPLLVLWSVRRGQAAARRNGPFVLRFSPAGFELDTRSAQLRQAWAGIARVQVQGGFLLVFCGKRCAYPVPLRQIEPCQVDAILQWARAGGVARVGA